MTNGGVDRSVVDFSLRLPGFTVHAVKYIDEKNHYLRYVLKDRNTGQVYLVILFTLVRGSYLRLNRSM